VIQRQLVDKLALKLLEGEFRDGDVVRVDAERGIWHSHAEDDNNRPLPGVKESSQNPT